TTRAPATEHQAGAHQRGHSPEEQRAQIEFGLDQRVTEAHHREHRARAEEHQVRDDAQRSAVARPWYYLLTEHAAEHPPQPAPRPQAPGLAPHAAHALNHAALKPSNHPSHGQQERQQRDAHHADRYPCPQQVLWGSIPEAVYVDAAKQRVLDAAADELELRDLRAPRRYE